jgi:hypothetical protein
MSDIFVSYTSDDRNRVLALVQALEKTGWTIFWDRTIQAGKDWRQTIDTEIQNCRSVIVVWSQKSVHSKWVLEEAEIGKRKEILVPVLFDEVEPPFGFGSIQAADLITWNGTDSDSSFTRFISDAEAVLGPAPGNKGQPENRGLQEGGKGKTESSRLPEGKEPKIKPAWPWFKDTADILVATLIVSTVILVACQIYLWDLTRRDVFVIVLFVFFSVMAIKTICNRLKGKRAHAID